MFFARGITFHSRFTANNIPQAKVFFDRTAKSLIDSDFLSLAALPHKSVICCSIKRNTDFLYKAEQRILNIPPRLSYCQRTRTSSGASLLPDTIDDIFPYFLRLQIAFCFRRPNITHRFERLVNTKCSNTYTEFINMHYRDRAHYFFLLFICIR